MNDISLIFGHQTRHNKCFFQIVVMKPFAVTVLIALAATATFKWATAHDNSYEYWMTIKGMHFLAMHAYTQM